MSMMKYGTSVLAVALIFVAVLLPFVLAFQGNSSSYTSDQKFDSITGSQSTTNSSSFIQRFIGGLQAVANYTSNLFSGRFGILDNEGVIYEQISACANLSSQNVVYNLTQSVNSAGTCFNITANNITLSCNGFTINYSISVAGQGVYNRGYNDSVIENCVIGLGRNNATNSYALFFRNMTGNRTIIRNNTIITGGNVNIVSGNYGVFLSNADFVNITDNRMFTLARS